MSDFMPWLYAHYIKPQGDYAFHIDLVRNNLRSTEWNSLSKAMEFTAIQAFLLGMRTGEELAVSRR